MNRSLCKVVLAAAGILPAIAGSAAAEAVTYSANFDTDAQGWTNDGGYWSATDGQSGGYVGGTRAGACPYLTPPTDSSLYGNLPATFGGTELRFSYYLKCLGGSPTIGGQLLLFADTDSTSGWDTLWVMTASDTSVPTDWRKYEWTVDTSAAAAPANWSRQDGTGSWADSWKGVAYWNFWSSTGSGAIDIGIDSVSVSAVPEPGTIVALATGLFGLLAYAWRRRK